MLGIQIPLSAYTDFYSWISNCLKYPRLKIHNFADQKKNRCIRGTAPPNPRSLEELQLNFEEIKTYSNKRFLFFDTCPGPNRI